MSSFSTKPWADWHSRPEPRALRAAWPVGPVLCLGESTFPGITQLCSGELRPSVVVRRGGHREPLSQRPVRWLGRMDSRRHARAPYQSLVADHRYHVCVSQ